MAYLLAAASTRASDDSCDPVMGRGAGAARARAASPLAGPRCGAWSSPTAAASLRRRTLACTRPQREPRRLPTTVHDRALGRSTGFGPIAPAGAVAIFVRGKAAPRLDPTNWRFVALPSAPRARAARRTGDRPRGTPVEQSSRAGTWRAPPRAALDSQSTPALVPLRPWIATRARHGCYLW